MLKPLCLALCILLASTWALAAPRTLDTPYGPVTLQGSPTRVITLDESSLDAALAVGVQPVGTVSTRGSDQVSAYLQERAGQPQIVGTARAPNLEAILKLAPDLILAPAGVSQELFATYSRIAPTVASKNSSMNDWQATTALYALALDRQAQGQQVLAAIDQRAAELKARLPAEQRVSVVRWNPQGPIAMSGRIFVGQMLHKVGLQTTELANGLKGPHSDVLSLENLSRIDADWLFVASLNADGASALEAARQQPAFTRLHAVRQNHVATVDGQVWASGSGPLAAHKVLDDLQRILAP